MAASVTHPSLPVGPRPVPLRQKIYGFGSVYAKTLHDSRLSFLVMAGLLAGIMLAVGGAIPTAYPTQAGRDEMARLAKDMGAIASGIAGKPVNVGTLGGYVQWKYGSIFGIMVALWSILALSGTLAGEARRGSLDIVASAPFGKRRIAIEKLAAHLTVVAVSLVIFAVAAWVTGAAFGKLPGDAIPPEAAAGFALWLGAMALWFGGLTIALSPFLGRGASAGIAGAALFVGWITNGYAATAPALAPIAVLTPWAWTANHLPLAGQFDWPTLVPTAVVGAILLAIGLEAFARRDLGAASTVHTPGLPSATLGLRGAIGRSFGDRLPITLAWGLGLGLFGLGMASISGQVAAEFAKSPDIEKTFSQIFPTMDIRTAGGFLQLFGQLLFIVAGFAAATLVSGWASDETSGRLEMLLSTPLSRAPWAWRSGLGVFGAIALMTALLAAGIGAGAALAGSDPIAPMAGSLTLGLYAAAVAGIGFAIGGFRTSIAAEVVAIVVTATYLIDLIAPAVQAPDWVHQLALTAHLGQPMVGRWDAVGVVACLALAVGGLAIGAWAVRRRDIAR